jgi:hypothetical protein
MGAAIPNQSRPKVETLTRPRNRAAAIIHDKMIAIQILFAALCVYVARLFFRTSTYPLANFPEIARGHTCVHLLTPGGIPYSPAVMLFPPQTSKLSFPIFIDLYTNKTVTHYTGTSFRRIYMTSPVYRRQSLHHVLRSKPVFQFESMSPAVHQILDGRNTTWWTRCHRHWLELRTRRK